MSDGDDLASLRAELAALRAEVELARSRHDDVVRALQALMPHTDTLARVADDAHGRGSLALAIEAVRAVADATFPAGRTPDDAPLVTVITPTHDRRPLLEEAVHSLRSQSYGRWEHLIAVDRCSDDTLAYVEELAAGDPRVRYVETDFGRCGAARNVVLDLARGDYVVYLDDDNQFEPRWLASVAWAFSTFPDVDLLYGALVIDHARPHDGSLPRLPEIHLRPFDAAHLTEANYVDMGTIAHRNGLAGARFDHDLRVFGDWDLFGRLAATTPPLPLPALSVIYRTDVPNRLSELHEGHPDFDTVRSRLHRLLVDGTPPGAGT